MRWAKLFHTFINSKRLFQLQSVFAKQVILDLQPLLTSFTPRNMSFGGMLTENRNSYIFKKLVVERQMTLLLTSEIASFFFFWLGAEIYVSIVSVLLSEDIWQVYLWVSLSTSSFYLFFKRESHKLFERRKY